MTGLPNQRSRSFAQAAFSYEGVRDYEHVENFLTAARKYKATRNLLDVDALRSVHMILRGDAVTWWNGIRDEIATWNDFESQLRKAFSPTKPAYIIYQEISELRQKSDELTERFVAKQRALFNQLPSPGLTEEVQLDMMYGFLHPKIQEQIPRECIESFDGLLEAARGIEQEKLKDKCQAKGSTEKTGRKRVRCSFCRNFGHLADVCRKKQKMLEEAEKSGTSEQKTESPASPEPATATPQGSTEPKSRKTTLDIRPRVQIEVSIGTAKELGFVDSCATISLASHKLYSYLKNMGFHFQEVNTTVTLADWVPKPQTVLKGRIPVKIKDRCILTTFMVMPEATNCDTLLGVEFLQDAGIILNLPQLAWSFVDTPDVYYDLIQEE